MNVPELCASTSAELIWNPAEAKGKLSARWPSTSASRSAMKRSTTKKIYE